MQIGYTRVSTEEQILDLQLDALAKEGIAPDDIYSDKISGAKAKRTGLDLAFKRLREGDVLVVWKLDRLGRDLLTLLQVAEMLRGMGVDFKSLTEPMVDIKTPMGRFMYAQLGLYAQLMRDQLLERTIEGMKAAAKRGRFGGRKKYLNPADERELKILLAYGDESLDDIAPRFRIQRRTIFNYVPGGRDGLIARIAAGEEADPRAVAAE